MKKNVPVIYLGERCELGGIRQAFKTKSGKLLNYSGIKGVWFGAVYMAEQSPSGYRLMQRPERIESAWSPTEAECIEYDVQKLCVSVKRQERRKEMAVKKPHDDILKAVELLSPFFRGLGRFDQQRFMKWIENQCVKRIYVKPKRK